MKSNAQIQHARHFTATTKEKIANSIIGIKRCPTYSSVKAPKISVFYNILHCSQIRENTCFWVFKVKHTTFATIKIVISYAFNI